VATDQDVEAFLARWAGAGGGERSNYQLFLTELCQVIDVALPEPAVEDERQNAYVFERKVPHRRIDGPSTANFIDLYKRGSFVLEAKQSAKRQKQVADLQQLGLDMPELRTGSGRREGAQWDTIMRNAREQAETYAKRLPPSEGWPPFLIVVDVGHVIELYADFSLQGKHYAQFPDRRSYRIYLEDLRDPDVRERLHRVWSEPELLNPARRTAEVTREIAELLAKLSKSLETRLIRALPGDLPAQGSSVERRAIAEKVALFLMRCLFTMFAEDVGLLKRDSFSGLLAEYRGQANRLHIALVHLWQQMNEGGFSPVLRDDVLRFNGGLFQNADALEITEDDLNWLIIAAGREWQDVEPAIFGTLLERALDPRERHSLGAHYTPRVYVERLVVPTIIAPLTEDWRNVQAAAAQMVAAKKTDAARREVEQFHSALCNIRVLDPACGTGNFLYVAMELMKRLEGEVLETLSDLGADEYLTALESHTVDPHQFLGLEINPRAVAIAELVLWIGYLQWHFRTRGRVMPSQPVLRNFHNILEQDAILAYDGWDILRDDAGRPLSHWDGVTFKLHPVTGEEVPDEDARIELRTYKNPRPADWPEADFIVGNPPFIGKGALKREALGDGYVEALQRAWPSIPLSADFVMYWWEKAAQLTTSQKISRFGLITTNSLRQTFNQRVVRRWLEAKDPLALKFAIADHPWVKAPGNAAVRIAMTVADREAGAGLLLDVVSEHGLATDAPTIKLRERAGQIRADLTIGADVSNVTRLEANARTSWNGVMLAASGFLISATTAGTSGLIMSPLVRPFLHGNDLNGKPRRDHVIDTYNFDAAQLERNEPRIYQYLIDHVKPQRDVARDRKFREDWWLFGRNRPALRSALSSISRFVATTETSKFRNFHFVESSVLPDHMVVAIALDDAFFLGVLSSRFHVVWALAAGGRLGVGNDPRYNKTRCFDPFPFPDASEAQKSTIRELAERLDAHRKDVLAKHSQLTMTGLYNVLQKLRDRVELSDADRDVYHAGLVGVLRRLHDDLDAAVAEAYGWPADLNDEAILERLVALNHERAAEERRGEVRWLRPEFQAPKAAAPARKAEQVEAELAAAAGKAKKPTLPRKLPDQVAAVRAMLARMDDIVTPAQVAREFSQGKKAERRIEDVLRTLTMLGQAEQIDGAYFLSQ